MAIHKNLKKRLSEEQIEAYMKWEERWKGKRWYGEDGNKRFDELLEIVLPGYKRKGEVTGGQKKVLIECDKGHDWEVDPRTILVGNQCLTCSQQKRIRDVWDVYYSIIEKIGYEMNVKTYISMHKQAKFKCKNGNWFWGKPNYVEQGLKKCQCKACKKERGKRKYRTKEEYIEELRKRGFILDPKDWKDSNVKTKMWCIEGQHWTCQRPSGILNHDYGCAVCSGNAKFNLNKLQKELFGPEGYTIKEGATYINNKTPIPLICPKGHDCEISVNSFKRGRRCRQCFYDDKSEKMSGESNPMYGAVGANNPNYKHSKSEEERERDRTKPEYVKTRTVCFQRDNYTCKITGKQGDIRHHHLDSYNWCEERRYDLNNVVTILHELHEEFHNKYGRGNNTRDQFIEFLESLIKENRFPERKQHILALIDWIEETRDKMDFNHLEDIKQIAG